LALEGFNRIPEQIVTIQQRTEVFRSQGRGLTEECANMNLVIFGRDEFDYIQAANVYHDYLNTEKYFPDGAKYVYCSAESSCSNFRDCCVDEGLKSLESGTLLINNAERLCSQGKSRLSLIKQNRQSLTIILALQTKEITKSLEEVMDDFPLRLQLQGDNGNNRLEAVLDALLKSVESKFKGRMRFEGGSNGPFVRLCARRILKDCDKHEQGIKDGVKSSLQKIYNQQLERLLRTTTIETHNGKTYQLDYLLLTSEDLLGTPPDSSTFQIKEWHELQEMIGLETVKSSIQSLMDGLLVNHFRDLNEQKPLQISLSRLFLGPPGTGKTHYLISLITAIPRFLGFTCCCELPTRFPLAHH
jgi:hypothetical protein